MAREPNSLREVAAALIGKIDNTTPEAFFRGGLDPELDALRSALAAEEERERQIAALVEAVKLCQVRVFMHDGSENETYRNATLALLPFEVKR